MHLTVKIRSRSLWIMSPSRDRATCYSKVLTIAMTKDDKARLRRWFGFGVGREIRRWIEADTPASIHTPPVFTEDLTGSITLLLSADLWKLVRAKASAMHTFPSRLVRQILADRLEHLPTPPTD